MPAEDALSIAYYVTGHGYGHATRSIEVCKWLISEGHTVVVVSGAPSSLFLRELASPRVSIRKSVLDCGSKQLDAFTVDTGGSLEAYRELMINREVLLETEVSWLRATQHDLVVSDTVPLAFAAAAKAGIPCAAVTNFAWDFIYSEYLSQGPSGSAASDSKDYRNMVWQIAEDFSRADVLLRLPGYSPMPAFREVVDVPLVVRHANKTRQQVRSDLGIQEGAKLVVFMYGGQPPGDWQLRRECLPDSWVCVVCSGGKLPGGRELPPNFMLADADAYTPDLIAAADCVLGKIGYGSMSECLAHSTPMIFVRRDYFNEEPFLRKLLEIHHCCVEMKRRDFLAGNWRPFLEHAAALRPEYRESTDGAATVGDLLVQLAHSRGESSRVRRPDDSPVKTASGGLLSSPSSGRGLLLSPGGSGVDFQRNGSVRLRDAIVWGYLMARSNARQKVDIPEWYTRGALPMDMEGIRSRAEELQLELDSSGGESPTALGLGPEDSFLFVGDEQQRPDLSACPDTLDFLALLARLDDTLAAAAPDCHELPERRAARNLFRWEDDVFVARAPGRLDVMGGIADYSGSLVLQLPTAQACHVAVQRHPVDRQPLWRHIEARHATAGRGPVPVLRIVSLHADATNRCPTFDMDLPDLLGEDGQPISYREAQDYFKSDPAVSWAAYVAGCVLVLMRECGAAFPDGLSLLVSSAVPEGKGVSSSAALEVAAMTALAAAHGLQLDARRLALLCQKVENEVVGAPCGVMDQMASAMGLPARLMSLTCQPAQLERSSHVAIPPTIQFFGVDSGIRHSVGGADYGAVRVGAFMGLRILQDHAARLRGAGGRAVNHGLQCLCQLSPSEFEEWCAARLPEALRGADFLQRYGAHLDAATSVLPQQSYKVRRPAGHPVYENFRCRAFRALLAAGAQGQDQLLTLGELMFQSHASYSQCGLGSDGTDRLVGLVRRHMAAAREAGEDPQLYGAKITGGGSGGTVCILASSSQQARSAVEAVVDKYRQETGHTATVFEGSSMGAAGFGWLHIRRQTFGQPE